MMPGGARTGVVFVFATSLACVACIHQVRSSSGMLVRGPAVTTVMSRQVENAIDAGENDSQLRLLRKRLAANASDLDARVLLARIYLKRGLPDLALEHYRLASAQFPESPLVAFELAKTLREMGEREGALTTIEHYIAKYPRGSWELRSLEGILADELGRFAAGETAHRAALLIDPGRAALHNNLGFNLMLQGQPDGAATEFRRAIEIDSRSEIAHNNLGAALVLQSHSVEALAEWRRSANPAVAHNNLAAVLIEQGRYPEARSELEVALGFRRDFSAAIANLRLVSQKDGRPAVVPATPPRSLVTKSTGVASPASEPVAAQSGVAVRK